MKRYQKNIIRIGVAFLAALVTLLFFSSTIERMLLPQVKVCEPVMGDIEGHTYFIDRYLLPKAAVVDPGETGTVYIVYRYGAEELGDIGTVEERTVEILAENELYYEVKSEHINISQSVIYSTSKEFGVGDRVYIAEEV